MIIDSHQHFWKYNPIRDAWIDDSMSVIRKDFLPKDLESVLQKNEVDGCIAVQADQSEEETNFLLECALENEFIKGVVGWVDLTDEQVETRLAHFASNPLFKGVRHIVQAEKEDYLLRKDVQNGISKLAEHNLTFDILVFPHQLAAAVQMVEKFPKQQFILDHIAKPNISAPMDKEWKENISALSKFENVSCKISGMVTETKNFIFNDSDFNPFLDVVFESFGSHRLMYGSDWPVCLLAADYNKVFTIIHDYLERHLSSSKDQVLGINAVNIYNL
ncbi:MAG: amidohydrolase [Marinovum sp.]|nr:amidohydrolase [Marinovum sp.]|tara:strand:+ start:260 stop:1084 length:825 start_codon:yes stop_codon:yes gene_type:complete